MRLFSNRVALGFLFWIVFASGWSIAETSQNQTAASQPQRLALLKSKGTEASLSILPVQFTGRPSDLVTNIIGLLLERQGLKTIELSKTVFGPEPEIDLPDLASSAGEFVKRHPVMTDYVLYIEVNGSLMEGLKDFRMVVVDKAGDVIWSDSQTKEDDAIKEIQSLQIPTICQYLVRRLSPQLGLNDETAKAAKPGKIAAMIREQIGPPPAGFFGQAGKGRSTVPEQATLKGRITDPEHAAVPGTTVTIVNEQTGTTHTIITDSKGEYQVLLPVSSDAFNGQRGTKDTNSEGKNQVRPYVRSGEYWVTVNLQGFLSQYKSIFLKTGQVAVLDFQLERIHHSFNPMGIMYLGFIYCMPGVPLAAVLLLFGYFRRRIRWSIVEVLILFAPLLVYWTLDTIGVVPLSVHDSAVLANLRHWQARGDATKGYTVILDVLGCGFFAGLIPLPRVWTRGSRIWTWAGATVVIVIALALYFLTPASY